MNSRPVFVDPSGRRRRVLRRVGLGGGAALVTCLGAVVVALAGGPQAPFTHWAAPRPAAPAMSGHARSGARHGVVGPSRPDPGAGPVPSPSGTRPRPSPKASPSPPAPTNPAGHTPPGHDKSPDPRKSPHGH